MFKRKALLEHREPQKGPEATTEGEAILASASLCLEYDDPGGAIAILLLNNETLYSAPTFEILGNHLAAEARTLGEVKDLPIAHPTSEADEYLRAALKHTISLGDEPVAHLLRAGIFCSLATLVSLAEETTDKHRHEEIKHYLKWASQHLAYANNLVQALWLETWIKSRQADSFRTDIGDLLVTPFLYQASSRGGLVPFMPIFGPIPGIPAEFLEPHSLAE